MGKEKDSNQWKGYEELIYKVYKELEPIADVKLNDFILGFESSTKRQIDVSIRSKIANHEILIIIQAKNIKKRADIKVLGEFDSVIRDVRVSKGIIICNLGFTVTAKEYAKKRKIDLCTVHDATSRDWKGDIQIPVLKKSVRVWLTIQHHYVVAGPVTIEGIEVPFPAYAIQQFLKKWEANELTKEPGTHYLSLDRDAIRFHNDLIPLKNGIEYKVEHRYHFKFFKPIDYRGIKDYITNNFTPSFIEFKEAIPFLNDGTWQYVQNPNEIPLETSHLQIEIISIDMLKKKMVRMDWVSK